MHPMTYEASGFREGRGPGPRAGEGVADDAGKGRFESVWQQCFPELYRRSLDWTSGRREDAEDALGQAAVSALQKMPRDLQPGEARAWLLRLVYSKCMDIHRQRRRSRVVVREVDDPALEQQIAAPEPSHESALLDIELAAVARMLILRLPPRLRSVAELHFLQDKKYPEIADALAITEVNVRKRVQHSRSLLRERMQAYLEGDATIRASRGTEAGEGHGARDAETDSFRESRWSLAALRKYVDRHPRGWKKRWELAVRLREEGALEEAVGHLHLALRRQPRRAELWIELGATLERLGRSGEARDLVWGAFRWVHDEAGRARLRESVESFRGRSGEAGT